MLKKSIVRVNYICGFFGKFKNNSFATPIAFSIKEYDVVIEVPDEYDIVYGAGKIYQGSNYLYKMGYSEHSYKQKLQKSNIIIDCVKYSGDKLDKQFGSMISRYEGSSFDQMSDADIDIIKDQILTEISGKIPIEVNESFYFTSANSNKYLGTKIQYIDSGVTINGYAYMTVRNNILYCYYLISPNDNKARNSIEGILDKTAYTSPLNTVSQLNQNLNQNHSEFEIVFWSIFLGFILTVTLYTLPIVFYRYVIKKAPIEKKKAKVITIVYGIAAFIVMTIILALLGGGGAGLSVLFWSFINYKIMTSGKAKEIEQINNVYSDFQSNKFIGSGYVDADSQNYVEYASNKEAPRIRYCPDCGFELTDDTIFCGNCGKKVY